MTSDGITFVTVVFEAELPLIRVQARSMARFMPPDLAHEILVIDNSRTGLRSRQRSRLLAEYGPLAARVRILLPNDITNVPPASGWLRQQVLKLAVAPLVTSDRYVVLDAKNHLVATPSIEFFQSADGRARATAYSFASHPLRSSLERVLEYVGVDPRGHLDRFTSTITPFVLETARVRDLLRGIEVRSGHRFAEEFVARDLTEFFLYSGWIIANGERLGDAFQLHSVACPVVWGGNPSVRAVRAAIDQVTEQGSPFFAVHRRALVRLDRAACDELASFWVRVGLFDSATDVRRFRRRFRVSFLARQALGRLRDLPHRCRLVLHRAG